MAGCRPTRTSSLGWTIWPQTPGSLILAEPEAVSGTHGTILGTIEPDEPSQESKEPADLERFRRSSEGWVSKLIRPLQHRGQGCVRAPPMCPCWFSPDGSPWAGRPQPSVGKAASDIARLPAGHLPMDAGSLSIRPGASPLPPDDTE